MQIAYFDGEPDAQAAAQVLQELGFNAEVHRCTDETYAETVKKFFDGVTGNFERNAVVESDADPESFETVVMRHHGRVTEGEAEQKTLDDYRRAEQIGRQHLATFDTLDFDVFSNQDWSRFHESHAPDIVVHWPDGHVTNGIDVHIADMKKLFVHAPDTRIKEHPIKIAMGEWTSVVGIMEGTFTKPLTTDDGKIVEPNGKAFKIMMCTVGHWNGDVMNEEYLFWDNATYAKQLGLA